MKIILILILSFSNLAKATSQSALLRIIDKEVLKMANLKMNNKDKMKWTKDNGVQPINGYELDYSEKCMFISNTTNKKALKACEKLGFIF